MSVSWKDDCSPARKKAEASGDFSDDNAVWMEYVDLRESLIWALLRTGFPPRSQWAITEDNWQQLYIRLQILESVGACYRSYNNGDKPPRDVYFTPEEVRSMVGLEVNAGSKSDAEFKNTIWKMLNESANDKLKRCTEPHGRLQEDPYYYERMYAPRSAA